MDGVLYRGNQLIPGAREFIERLQQGGHPFLFLTNNSQRTPLDFQRKLIDEQPWLAPLLAVFADRGLNKLQAGPYPTREEARGVAARVRAALHLVPTIVEKR